jgi:predicted ATPase
VLELGPLAVPARPVAGEESGADLSGVASVSLFCERASSVSSRFASDPSTLAGVGEICRRLEGLPLAIELVAAYTRLLPSDVLLSRLDAANVDAFELLRGGPRDAAPRHRDLRSAIRFSYDLLEDDRWR